MLIIRQWSLKTKIVFLSWLFNKELTSSSQEGIVISSVIGFFVLICNVMLLIGIQYFGLFEVFKQELWAMVKWGMGDPAIQLSNLKNWSLTQWASGMAAPVAMYWSVILTARYLFYLGIRIIRLIVTTYYKNMLHRNLAETSFKTTSLLSSNPSPTPSTSSMAPDSASQKLQLEQPLAPRKSSRAWVWA